MKTILVDAVYTFIVEDEEGAFKIFEPMYEMLEGFPDKKIILTNADHYKFQKYALDKTPYEVFTLEHNPEKTNPEYFRILLKKYELKPKDVIYFEHDKEAVKSAKLVGIKTYYYDSETKNIGNLKDFLDSSIID